MRQRERRVSDEDWKTSVEKNRFQIPLFVSTKVSLELEEKENGDKREN